MNPTPESIVQPDGDLGDGRVGLRAWRLDDAAHLAAGWADAEVASWTAVPDDPSEAAARRWISGAPTRSDEGVSVDFVVVERDEAVGEIGLAPIDWERRAAQVGYWLLPTARGRGLATVAMRLVTAWAVTSAGLGLLVARCHPDNPASANVARAAGYQAERADPQGFDLYVYRS